MRQKILVVDDDSATLLGFVELLRGVGYDAVGARTLPAARQALLNEAPDLLIVDVRLEAFNGLQLVATTPRPIPSIVITGFPDPTLRSEAHRFGAQFFLKPVAPAELLKTIASLLATGQGNTVPLTNRRWPRTTVTTPIVARVDGDPVRIVDISYGGLRLEIDRAGGAPLGRSFGVTFPARAVSVDVAVVWEKSLDGTRAMYGATVVDHSQEWEQLVDAVS